MKYICFGYFDKAPFDEFRKKIDIDLFGYCACHAVGTSLWRRLGTFTEITAARMRLSTATVASVTSIPLAP